MKYTRILFVAALTIAAISLPANAQLLGGVVRGSTNSAGSVGGRSGSVTGGLNSDSRLGGSVNNGINSDLNSTTQATANAQRAEKRKSDKGSSAGSSAQGSLLSSTDATVDVGKHHASPAVNSGTSSSAQGTRGGSMAVDSGSNASVGVGGGSARAQTRSSTPANAKHGNASGQADVFTGAHRDASVKHTRKDKGSDRKYEYTSQSPEGPLRKLRPFFSMVFIARNGTPIQYPEFRIFPF